jgi:hypothetical protein
MVANGEGVEISGRSRTPRAWLIFGCSVYGVFGLVLVVGVLGMAIDLAKSHPTGRSMLIAGVVAAVGIATAFECLAKFRIRYSQLSAHRNIAP